jgi:hypothetical protein
LKKTYLREILPRIEDAKKTAHDIQSKLWLVWEDSSSH